MKCPHCGYKWIPRKKKTVDPTRVAQDLLKGFGLGLQGPALMKFAQKSLPKQVTDARSEVRRWPKGKRATIQLEGNSKL